MPRCLTTRPLAGILGLASSTDLIDGYLTRAGAIGSGHMSGSAQYWTFVHSTEGVIYRAAHPPLDTVLDAGDFVAVVSGSSIGLGASYHVESPGYAVNRSGATYLPLALALWRSTEQARSVTHRGGG